MLPDKQTMLWRFALASLQRELPVVLLYVVESKGSSPGRPGFFMVINGAGEKERSIGGGIMEHKFTEAAREQLRRDTPVMALRRQVHDKEAAKDQSGMICSGEQTILVCPLARAQMGVVERLLDSLEHYGNGCLRLTPEGMAFSPQPPPEAFCFRRRTEDDWSYEERTGYTDRLFIIGGGHVALALSRVMRTMDFYITLVDHRRGLDSFVRNEYVQEKVVVGDYAEVGQLVPGGGQVYILVMTQGYRTDDQAIRALWEKEFRYFGVLGSKAKIDKMLAGYRAEGIDDARLRRLRAPAGLAIHSQTPEEIAVSIAAEIIQYKHGKGYSRDTVPVI
jgi:xanthine dehydrogenase accessory factor